MHLCILCSVVGIESTGWAGRDPQLDLIQVLVFQSVRIEPGVIGGGEQKSMIY